MSTFVQTKPLRVSSSSGTGIHTDPRAKGRENRFTERARKKVKKE